MCVIVDFKNIRIILADHQSAHVRDCMTKQNINV